MRTMLWITQGSVSGLLFLKRGVNRREYSSGCGGVSLLTRRPMISLAIDPFLERGDADALHDVDEALGVAVAMLEVALDQLLDDLGNLGAGE